ncbi:MAG: hypothetical protein M1832_006036 [Thelocarpon impressellum]|nr:MAG: hypothetical protein M1832_006036 [Thelocarpon impressellum]
MAFMDLPPEIRNLVYEQVFRGLTVAQPGPTTEPALLRTSRRIAVEARRAYLMETHFVFNELPGAVTNLQAFVRRTGLDLRHVRRFTLHYEIASCGPLSRAFETLIKAIWEVAPLQEAVLQFKAHSLLYRVTYCKVDGRIERTVASRALKTRHRRGRRLWRRISGIIPW